MWMKVGPTAVLALMLSACDAAQPAPRQDAGPAPIADAGVDAGTPPPFGATTTAGITTFRVWAPNASRAAVDLDGERLTMTPQPQGTFAAMTASPVTRWRYVFDNAHERLDPYCRQITADRQWCLMTSATPYTFRPFTKPARNEAIVYELHIGSFSTAAGMAHGTFASAQAKLPELAELGINVIELMPVHAFGGNPNGWGYNPHLFFAPKPSYGTPEELKAFIDEAHRLGIAVWSDLVINHTDGWRQAPLSCFDGHCPNGAWGIYFFGPGPYAETPWGPRPNYTEPRVTEMLLGSAKQWLTELNGDGFRIDSVSNIRAIDGSGTTPGGREVLVKLNELTQQHGGLSIAEDLKGYGELTKSKSAGGFGFDAQWDGFGYDVMNVLVPFADDDRDLGAIERALKGGYNGDGFARLLWTENHDTVGNGGARLPTKIDSQNPESFAARRRSMLAAVVLFTSPGMPMLFQGQEQLASGGFVDPPAQLAAPTARGLEVRAFYKALIGLRRSEEGLKHGDLQVLHFNDANKVIVYKRGETLVILNLRNRAYTRYDFGVPMGGTWRVRLDSDALEFGSDFGGGQSGSIEAIEAVKDGQPFTLPVKLGAYGAVVLTR
ncbi:MAG: alpha amylase C-terminal domain-containing protein [Myxococcaceae bacterium]|nr:alpha amylase C-terminal domain-containing protein [Myxococcaceae bacterium]